MVVGRAASGSNSGRPRWKRWVVELSIAVAVYVAVSAWRSRDALPTNGETKAPAFELRSLDGRVVRLEDYRGKTVLLHFWATWCRVCKLEVPMMKALQNDLGDGRVILTIASSDPADVRRFVSEKQLPYPVLLGNRGVSADYRVSAFPTNYVIDPDGYVVSHTVGLSTRAGLRIRMGLAE
jgi:peroxiredoxin